MTPRQAYLELRQLIPARNIARWLVENTEPGPRRDEHRALMLMAEAGIDVHGGHRAGRRQAADGGVRMRDAGRAFPHPVAQPCGCGHAKNLHAGSIVHDMRGWKRHCGVLGCACRNYQASVAAAVADQNQTRSNGTITPKAGSSPAAG